MPASFFGLLPSHDHLAEDVHGDHGERQQNGGSQIYAFTHGISPSKSLANHHR